MSDTNKKSVTIITLMYRDYRGLSETIKSVFSQNLSEVDCVEYLLVDDGSDNFSKDEVMSAIGMHKQSSESIRSIIVYSNNENLGTVKSFNKAIERSSGDIIIPLSCGDEFFDSYSVDTIVNKFSVEGFSILTASREIVGDNGPVSVEPARDLIKLFAQGNEKKLLKRLSLKGNFISGACTYYSRDFLQQMGGFDEEFRLLEDYPMYLRALNNGYRISYVDEVLMKHKVGGVSDRSQPINYQLCKDYERVRFWIQSNIHFDDRDKRLFIYFQLMSRRERLSLYNAYKYPDCLFFWFFSALLGRIFRVFKF